MPETHYLKNLRSKKIENIQVSEQEEDYQDSEISIYYATGKRLAISSSEYVIVSRENGIIERNLFDSLNHNYLSLINHEVVRATHFLTNRLFKMKTDCKPKTIKMYLDALDKKFSKEEIWYTKRIIMQLQSLYQILNYMDGDVAPFNIKIEPLEKSHEY